MRSVRHTIFAVLVFSILTAVGFGVASPVATAQGSAGPSGYHLLKTVKLGGIGGWDYLTVDEATHRLFISRGTHVIVVDPHTGKVVGEIADTPGVHGVAVAPEFNRGYTTNGQTASSTIFELDSLKVLGQAKTDKDTDGIIYDPFSKRIFTFNGDANTASAIDAKSGQVVRTVPLGGGPEFGAADGKGHVFVNLEDKSAVVRINSTTLEIEATWPLAPCESPSGM